MNATPTPLTLGPRDAVAMLQFQQELDAIAQRTRQRLGASDARHIVRVLWLVRGLTTAGRLLLLVGWMPLALAGGAVLLGIAKILDNMELGHNVMHGQYDWMNDPRFQGDTFEWDNTCPKEGWRHTHNFVHHTYTNVIGKDRDFGYGMLRLSSDLTWRWFYHPVQFAYMLLLAVFFEWFVALHELQTDKLMGGKLTFKDVAPQWAVIRRKMLRQVRKDYVAWPLVGVLVGLPWGHGLDAGLAVLLGNGLANLLRNVWAWAIIFCGHFTDDVHIFTRSAIEGESKGQWYLRQILGSSNIRGSRLMHLLSGNLSHQIEHHLFPDLPSSRYAEVAPQVQAVCRQHGVPYNTGAFLPQLFTVFKRVARYSLPGGPQRARPIAPLTLRTPLTDPPSLDARGVWADPA